MGGFDALILIPEKKLKYIKDMEAYLVDFCWPYQSEFEFPSFRIPCDCIGYAHERGIKAANERFGTFHQLWRSFSLLPQHERSDWQSYIKLWEDAAIQAARSSPYEWHPFPNCEYCQGTGIAETNYYPHQLFQILGIGGGWANLGSAVNVTYERGIAAVLTPDDEVFIRWNGWQLEDYSDEDKWIEKVGSILREHPKCIAIKCFMD